MLQKNVPNIYYWAYTTQRNAQIFTHDYSFPLMIESTSGQCRILMQPDVLTSLHVYMSSSAPLFLGASSTLAGLMTTSAASKTITKQPRSVLPKVHRHGAGRLLESCTPVLASSHRQWWWFGFAGVTFSMVFNTYEHFGCLGILWFDS